jgi:hypothetical protein
MRRFISFCLLLGLASVLAFAQAAPPPPQLATRTPAKCRPSSFVEELFFASLSYAVTKSPRSFVRERGCQPAEQEPKPNARAKPTPEPKADSTRLVTRAEDSLAELPAAEVMRLARLLYVRPRSSWFNKEKLERELLKRKEFAELGLEITRNAPNANLILEITRKTFTTRFTCSIIEPSSERIVGSTTASSLGGEIEPHLAEAIIKQFKTVRSKSVTEEKKPE